MFGQADYQSAVSEVAARPSAAAWYRLGCVLHELRRWGSAAGCFARCVALEPEHAMALTNLGWNLHLAGRGREGLGVLGRAINLAPDEAVPWAASSTIEGELGNAPQAVFDGLSAVKAAPDVPANHMALAFAHFGAGDWELGWREYGWRFRYKIPEFLTRPHPLWAGERVDRLFLEAEQGLGDTIFGLRWVREAVERSGAREVVLYVQREAYALAAGMALAGVVVKPLPQPLPQADAWCPLLSLPEALGGVGPKDAGLYLVWPIPKALTSAYWDARTPEEERVAYRAMRGAGLPPSYGEADAPKIKKIGICWAGSAEHEQAHHRDCPLAYWLRLTELPGLELHSLQVGPRAADLGELGCYGIIQDRAPEITNLRDTARVIEGLDLVISVDTAVAHLAGAMGAPVWVLINQRGRDFRWGSIAESTGWYPAMRLMRRGLDEDWGAVMLRVAAALNG